jgi:phytoene synthase
VDAELARAYAHCRRVVRRSGSSFAAAFWLLPAERRRALHAVYAFCRLADDIADEPAVKEDRSLLLARWREELDAAYLGKSTHPVGVALADAVHRYRLPQAVFEELLAGVRSDLRGEPIETFADLRRYCYRVASTVGILVCHLLERRDPHILQWAETLGVAVQLTNVLRDVGEDAARGRIYLPSEDLARFGVAPEELRPGAGPPPERVRLLLANLAEIARLHFERADALLDESERRSLRPARAMGRIYRALLDELYRQRFPSLERTVRLGKWRRLAIAASVWLEPALPLALRRRWA